MQSVAEAIAAAISDAGIARAFGLLGEGNLAIALALERQGRTEWVALRREDGVICAADGYAQGTQTCSIALLTHGPALTNAITPLVGALKGRTPLVVITGEIEPEHSHAPQYLNQRSLIEAIGIHYVSLQRAVETTSVIGGAVSMALAERMPVVVGVRTSLQQEPIDLETDPELASLRPTRDAGVSATVNHPWVPSPAELRAALAVLMRAERPLIIAGRGAVSSRDALVRFAEQTGCMLSTTLLARGLFAGHPRDVGVCGGFAPDSSRRAIAAADAVLAFGASLNDYTTGNGAILRHAEVVHVDMDPRALDHHYRVDVKVVGDVATTAEMLLDMSSFIDANDRWMVPLSAPSSGHPPESFDDESGESGLDLRTVSIFLDHHLPSPRGFVSDLGYFTSEPNKFVSITEPQYQAFCLHFGSIGLGLATAIGLSAAHPTVATLCAVGDGGLAAAMGELETLARTRLPVTVAVYNDSAYGVEWQALRHAHHPTALSEFPDVDFAGIASALGIPSTTVRTSQDFAALAALLGDAAAGPRLIDFKLNRAVLTSWYRELVLDGDA